LNFWRSKDKAEIDFVINLPKQPIPIEVKYKEFDQVKINRSLHSFIGKYNSRKALIINKNFYKKTKLNNTEVVFIPWWEAVCSSLDQII